jgi:RNA polymerase sigma factor (sigma-70 family)
MDRLTQLQQELVARHLGLVYLHVKRQLRRLPFSMRKRECDDLVQEGMMGLAKAASRYEPQRCGPFASYALAHIHGEICRYLLRQMDGLAMPESAAQGLVRQRRSEAVLVDPDQTEWAAGQTATEPSLPRFLDLQASRGDVADATYSRARQRMREEMDNVSATCGHARSAAWLHARYEQALRWAVEQVLATRGVRVDYAPLVRAVVQERLLVPEVEFRTSGRQIARRFGCSTARVWNVEHRLLRLARKNLADQAGVTHEAASVVCSASSLSDPARSPRAMPAVAPKYGHLHTRTR